MDTNNEYLISSTQVDAFQQGQILHGHFSNYSIDGFLGEGFYGKVVRCNGLTTGEAVAVKVMAEEYTDEGMAEVGQLEKIRKLCPDKNNLLKFTDHFMHQNHFCLVFEMLDMSLYDFMESRDWKPLKVSEIRPIAQQTLVALKALKSINLVHADIKPDNIMLVHHQSQPFKVKLIDFGLATEAPNLGKSEIEQNLSYESPEVLLGHPYLDEAVDMWALGGVLAFLYLAEHLYPMESEYEALRAIIHLNGSPDNEFLDAASKTRRFFNLAQEDPKRLWWLKSESEYGQETGESPTYKDNLYPEFFNMDGLIFKQEQRRDRHVHHDTVEFIGLLKEMLNVSPKDRITPEEALRHKFITMEHLPLTKNDEYVTTAKARMSVCSVDEDSLSAEHAEEKAACTISNSKDQGETVMSLKMELEQMKLSYEDLRLKYEADAHTSRQQKERLQLELKQEREKHAEREERDKELIKTLGAELDTLHQQMKQERTFLQQTLESTKMDLQMELEQMKLSYKDLCLKYEADVHTSRQEAERLHQELKKEIQTHAEREEQHEDLQKNLRVQLDSLHQQMKQERTFLQQALKSIKMDVEMELEQMKLSYKDLHLKYEADVHTSRQEAERLHQELKSLKETHAEREEQHEDLQKNLGGRLDSLHQQMEELSPWRCFKKMITPAHRRHYKSRRQLQDPQENWNKRGLN